MYSNIYIKYENLQKDCIPLLFESKFKNKLWFPFEFIVLICV